ncbi:MAG: tRNA (pseudouridine(54)-N(1))-methyltransferase TrmY [Halanaeroarchaeum sp.]
MRQFVVLGHDAPTDPEFSLDDLPGGAGRLDVLARSVAAAILVSHDVRRDTRIVLVFDDRVAIRIEGSEVRYMSPDERNVAGLLRSALESAEAAIGHQEVESTPGIYVSTRGLEAVISDLRGATVLQLHEEGDPVASVDPPANPAFVLSDHRDFTAAEGDLLASAADRSVSLSPEVLHADQAITVAHNWLDTGGWA